MMIGLVTEGEEEGEGEGKSHSKVGTRWVRQKMSAREKSNKCQQCDHAFSYAGDLRQHLN